MYSSPKIEGGFMASVVYESEDEEINVMAYSGPGGVAMVQITDYEGDYIKMTFEQFLQMAEAVSDVEEIELSDAEEE